MAIGPESRHHASGRVLVAATLHGVLGVAAIVIGLGPFIDAAGSAERGVGAVGIALGSIMLAAALPVGLRIGPARAAGMVGGAATAVLGLLVVVLAGSSAGTCSVVERSPLPCYLMLATVAVAGVMILGLGAASIAVISRARPEAFRRHRR